MLMSETTTVEVTVSPGSEEYKILKVVRLINRLPGVRNAEEVNDVR